MNEIIMNIKKTIIIGLTGNIASGKTNVCNVLKTLGAKIFNADIIGHSIYQPKTETYQKIINNFGKDIIDKDGTINRKILGSKVFGNSIELKKLTDIVWPEIKRKIFQEIEILKEKNIKEIIVIEAAALIEAGWQQDIDKIWLTIAPIQIIKERLRQRNLSEEEIEKRINSQITNEERIKYADKIIETDGTLEQTKNKIINAWNELLQEYKEN